MGILERTHRANHQQQKCRAGQSPLLATSLLKKPRNRLLTRAAQNRDLVFPSSY